MASSDHTSASVLPYFAYGSNMSKAQMEYRKVTFTHRRAAYLPGNRLAFNKHTLTVQSPLAGVGNILPDSGSTAHGILYEGTTDDSYSQLDIYEGVSGGHYYRKVVEVLVDDGDDAANGGQKKARTVRALTYVGCDDRVGDPDKMRPSREYLNRLLEGEDLLPKWYVDILRGVECIE